jgi:hypothetical protein
VFDAALLSSSEIAATPAASAPKAVDDVDGPGGADGEVWEDAAPLHKQQRQPAQQAKSQASELIDMRALDEKRRGQDDVKERLRIEETKGMLQKAKAGMEQRAKMIEEEKLEKERKVTERTTAKSSTGGGGLAGILGGSSGKWVPSAKRNMAGSGVGGMSTRFGAVSMDSTSASGFQKKVNTQDEEAFPDLAMADKILEHKEKIENKKTYVLPKKKNPKPVWAKPAAAKEAAPSAILETIINAEKSAAPVPVPDAVESVKSASTVPVLESVTAPAKRVIKKKKKKDLSTFKVGGSSGGGGGGEE